MGFSIIKYFGKQNSRCGYCKRSKGSLSYGMHTYQLTPQDYQDLIDRGWRRCGHYCYKQDNEKTCCPCYTIKCDALEFKLNKSHKKILKRMNRFLRDGKNEKAIPDTSGNVDGDDIDEYNTTLKECPMIGTNITDEVERPNIPLSDINLETAEISAMANVKKQQEHRDINVNNKVKEPKGDKNSIKKTERDNNVTPAPSKKAKQIRLERKLAKLAAKGLSPVDYKLTKKNEKTLRDFINEVDPENKHQLKLSTVYVKSAEFMSTLDESYKLYQKYQTTVHNDPPKNVENYLEFLQKSPLKLTKVENGPSIGYGTFHQQYWLDDKLIAVAVLDILPYCISSVYFFYDPCYNFLSLGTYSSLREIEFVQQLSEQTPSLKNYYMGFYIHSCPKMRYKARLVPSYLLCPEVYSWHLITDELRSKLDVQKYSRINNDLAAKDVNEFSDEDIYNILLLIFHNTCIIYGEFVKNYGEDERASLLEYGKLLGKVLIQRVLFLKTNPS